MMTRSLWRNVFMNSFAIFKPIFAIPGEEIVIRFHKRGKGERNDFCSRWQQRSHFYSIHYCWWTREVILLIVPAQKVKLIKVIPDLKKWARIGVQMSKLLQQLQSKGLKIKTQSKSQIPTPCWTLNTLRTSQLTTSINCDNFSLILTVDDGPHQLVVVGQQVIVKSFGIRVSPSSHSAMVHGRHEEGQPQPAPAAAAAR